jgi:hypothetical protein
MSMLRALCALAVVTAACAALPGSAAAATPVPSCNGGGCGGWFRSSVTVSWSYNSSGATKADGCGSTTISGDTSGTAVTCTVTYSDGRIEGQIVTVRKDSSPPIVTASASRGPDANGWYTSPVAVSFTGDDGASGVASCTSGTYGGPDGEAAAVTGSCTDNAGNTGSVTLTIKYDASPPTVLGVLARKPDANGWYNHPVAVEFRGNDAGSGVSECSPAVSYKGPDAAPAKLVGQCRDAAGHLSAPTTVELRYDGTPPARPNLRWVRRGPSLSLSWTATKDVALTKVTRSPGPKGKKTGVVYQGKARKFVDKKLGTGTRYWYQVTLVDQAGNESSKTIGMQATAGIFAPADGAVVGEPPVAQWAPVAKARFYNLQLWRGNLKLLTTWVKKPKLALPLHWSMKGARHSLVDGSYRLYVWPAFGSRRDPQYGKLLGQVGFVVKRR